MARNDDAGDWSFQVLHGIDSTNVTWHLHKAHVILVPRTINFGNHQISETRNRPTYINPNEPSTQRAHEHLIPTKNDENLALGDTEKGKGIFELMSLQGDL